MSREHETRYHLEEERKKEKIRDEVKRELEKINSEYIRMINSEYEKYIPEDMEIIKTKINNIKNLLSNAPKESRQLAFNLKQSMFNLDNKVEDIKLQMEIEKKQKKQSITMKKIENLKKEIQDAKIVDKNYKNNLLNSADDLQKDIAILENINDPLLYTINEKIIKINEKLSDVLIEEENRREVVKSVITQLNSQEFTVDKPKIIESNGETYIKITAKKPSGKRATCNIGLNGQMVYKFDEYKGQTCLKDIEKFNRDLEEIYSIKLSTNRVLWKNPDKISKEEKTTFDVKERNK